MGQVCRPTLPPPDRSFNSIGIIGITQISASQRSTLSQGLQIGLGAAAAIRRGISHAEHSILADLLGQEIVLRLLELAIQRGEKVAPLDAGRGYEN